MFKARTLKLILRAGLLIAPMLAASDLLAGGYSYTVVTPGSTDAEFDYPVINDRGEVAFDGADYNCGECEAVYKWRPGGQPEMLTSAPYATFPTTNFHHVTITNNGKVAFESLTGYANGSWSDTIIVANGTTLTRIAPIKHTAPDDAPFYYASPALLNDGSAVFYVNGEQRLQRAKAGKLQTIDTGEFVCGGSVALRRDHRDFRAEAGGQLWKWTL
jgi:hypothetical protein